MFYVYLFPSAFFIFQETKLGRLGTPLLFVIKCKKKKISVLKTSGVWNYIYIRSQDFYVPSTPLILFEYTYKNP